MAKITKKCGNCGKLTRKADAHSLKVDNEVSKYDYLCNDCFVLWLNDELEEEE